jgi:carbon-monoxide dehydrogenase medium subunit
MAFSHSFEYHRPATLEEAFSLLGSYGAKASLLAGGTDLAVYIKEGLAKPEAVIDLKRVADLPGLQVDDTGVFVGAGTTFSELVESVPLRKHYPLLWEAARALASVGIRNRATLVGNICSAVPSLDAAPALLCYDAVVQLSNGVSKRECSIHDWFLAPRRVAKSPTEIVLGVGIKAIPTSHAGIYLKLGRFRGEDLAQAGLGILVSESKEYRLAFCAVAPVPARARRIEVLMAGRELNPELINEAKALVSEEVSPITDIRASREYRLHVCEVMLERGLLAARQRLQGIEVDNLKVLGG